MPQAQELARPLVSGEGRLRHKAAVAYRANWAYSSLRCSSQNELVSATMVSNVGFIDLGTFSDLLCLAIGCISPPLLCFLDSAITLFLAWDVDGNQLLEYGLGIKCEFEQLPIVDKPHGIIIKELVVERTPLNCLDFSKTEMECHPVRFALYAGSQIFA